MADISSYHAGERFKIVVPNSKSIPMGTILEYDGTSRRCCGGTFKMNMVREDTGEALWCFDHWLERIM